MAGRRTLGKRSLYLLLAIFCIKGVLLALDSQPAYFLGDSAAYLATALKRYIPADRSFTYGLLIERIALNIHSLEAMIAFQVFLSALCACLIPFLLLKFFRVRFWIAAVCGILCAVEPLQLMMERFVMTETVANFLFAVYFALLIAYLRRGSIWMLAVAQVAGVLLLTIRMSFLLQVLAFSVLVPLLSPAVRRLAGWLRAKAKSQNAVLPANSLSTLAIHLCTSVLLLQMLLAGYARLNGHLSHRKPALLSESGIFLLADFLPMVQPEDCPIPSLRAPLFKGLQFDFHNRRNRLFEHWLPNEVIGRIQKFASNPDSGSALAGTIAAHAIKRNPLGVAHLAWQGFTDFFDSPFLLNCLKTDEGVGSSLPPDTAEALKTQFHVVNPRAGEPSLTKTWAILALPWYSFVLLLLPFWTLLPLLANQEDKAALALCAVSALLFFQGAVLAELPTARYLTSAAWLTLLLLGILLERLSTGRPSTANQLKRDSESLTQPTPTPS